MGRRRRKGSARFDHVLDLRQGEALELTLPDGRPVRIVVVDVSRRSASHRCRLGVEADPDVPVSWGPGEGGAKG